MAGELLEICRIWLQVCVPFHCVLQHHRGSGMTANKKDRGDKKDRES